MGLMMNSESMPPELDVFINLLGEIDMLKGQVSMLDKNTHIALGNAECFSVLKIIETLNANISALNASLLNVAELITAQYTSSDSQEKKTSSSEEAIADSREKIEKQIEEKKENKDLKRENQVINNMLSYFKERFEGNE